MESQKLLLILLAVPIIVMAGVNPKNGDFFITYKDIAQQSSGHELNLVRTYNSRAAEMGWLGFGWGSPYETRLIVMPDGSAAVLENGTGQITYYRADEKADIQRGVAHIVDAAIQHDTLSPDAAATLRQNLAADEDLRVRKVLQYELHADLPMDTVLHSDECSTAALVRMADRYQRVGCDGSNDYFDLQSRLIRREESDGYSVGIDYDGKLPVSIKDTQGQSLRLKWTPAGLLADATSGTRRHVIYTYDKNNDLVVSNDPASNRYDYEYDGNHNLTRIGYIDNTSMRIEYLSPATGMVKSVIERSGDKTVYEYRTDPADTRRTWTRVTAISAAGEQASREFEYRHTTTETGAELLAHVAANDGHSRRETAYDDKGRVIRQANDAGGFTEYVYHPQSDKLILVLREDMNTAFHYDERGNLTRAENSKGQVIEMDYADTSLIQRMVEVNRADKTRRELRFKYNANGRPTEITLAGTGTIRVEYDDRGEISKVASSQGAKMALQVTQAFQNLLRVVQVAGARF